MEPLISVIVPIYNVEQYLCRCVDSIINQTYKNLEIILVDDGSPDNCPEICDDYAKKDNRIKVIHKKNEGSAEARNAGIRKSNGDYFWFIDSDDYASEKFLELLLYTAIMENSQIVECNSVKVDKESDFFFGFDLKINKINTYNNDIAFEMLIDEDEFHHYVWNKIYHKTVINGIDFPKGKYIDDEYWTYKVFGRAQKISKIDTCLYCYVQHNSSAMNRNFNIKRLDMLEAKYEQINYVIKKYPSLYFKAKLDLFNACMFLSQSSMKYLKSIENDTAVNYIKSYLPKCKFTKSELNNFSGKQKIWYTFANRNFILCCRVRNFLNIGL